MQVSAARTVLRGSKQHPPSRLGRLFWYPIAENPIAKPWLARRRLLLATASRRPLLESLEISRAAALFMFVGVGVGAGGGGGQWW